MKKVRSIDRDHNIKLYKTPSPSNYGQLKSPRLNRNGINLIDAFNKRLNQQQDKNNNYRESSNFDVGSPYFVNKQEFNQNQSKNSKLKQNKRQIKYEQNLKKSNNLNKLYNSYFIQTGQINQIQKTHKNAQINPNTSRKSSLSHQNQSSQKNLLTKNSYQQTIRKLANQNIRLKHQCKVMQEKYQKLSLDKKNLIAQNHFFQTQIVKVQQNAQKKIMNMNEEINNLESMLKSNSEQLSLSNYQIYKMRQQIYHLTLISKQKQKQKQKVQFKSKSKGKLIQNKKPHESGTLINFQSQRLIPAHQQNPITHPTHPQPPICKNCLKNTNQIIQLINQIQNLKYLIIQKSTVINSFYKQLQKNQEQLKILQKPRQLYKKYNGMIGELTQEIVKLKFKELNIKYMKSAK